MIVFDLKCSANHVFECWFASSEAFADQQQRKLILCPVCGDTTVEKAVMAPAVATKSNRRPERPVVAATSRQPDKTELLARLAEAQAELIKSSQWVGDAFADRARAMHYGESEPEQIHGRVDAEGARALVEEGVPIAPLPFPIVPPDQKN